jgi:hypothetical protein
VFYKYTYDSLLRSQGTNQTATSIGACSVYSFQGNITSPVDPIRPEILDAGPVINVTGPTGTKQLTKVTGGVYAGELGGGTTGIPGVPPAAPLFLEPGTYTVDNGSGGPGANAVAAFRTTIKIAPFVKWENQGDITTVTRSQPLPITWSGGDADGYVIIIGSSATTAPVVGASFVCLEKASAKQFSVPPAVLLALPATGSSDTSIGSLIVTGTNGLSPFTAGGLDVGAVAASGGTLKTLKYQ